MGSLVGRITSQASEGFCTVTNPTYLQLIDEAVQAIAPSALSLRLARIDSAAKHVYPSIYDADKTTFRVKRCRAFIRRARTGEWDYTPDGHLISEAFQHQIGFQTPMLPNDALKSVKRFIPPLWCLVIDLGNGTHHVSTVYRGDAFFKTDDFEGQIIAGVSSTEELETILATMQERDGFDEASWKRYCTKLHEECTFRALGEANRPGTIH